MSPTHPRTPWLWRPPRRDLKSFNLRGANPKGLTLTVSRFHRSLPLSTFLSLLGFLAQIFLRTTATHDTERAGGRAASLASAFRYRSSTSTMFDVHLCEKRSPICVVRVLEESTFQTQTNAVLKKLFHQYMEL